MTNGWNFGGAIAHLKAGGRAAREGWNGKGMWLAYAKGGRAYGVQWGCDAELTPFIVMKTADDKFVPWLASQTDVLAEDWVLL